MKTTLALMIALGPLAWGSAGSAEPPEATVGALHRVEARTVLVGNQETDTLSATPMCVRIKAVVDSLRIVEERLQTEFYTATDDSLALRAVADLAELDRARKRLILEIQCRQARLEGRTRLAQRIDDSLLALAEPSAAGETPSD